MYYSSQNKIRILLQIVDALIAMSVAILAFYYPPFLMSTQGYVAAVAWYTSIVLIEGQNPVYLRPRHRLLISMTLTMIITAVTGIIWAGSGWTWYMKGGLEPCLLLVISGTLFRLLISHFIQQPTIQVTPFHIPELYRPLLAELSRQSYIHVEDEQDHLTELPPHRSGYTTYVVACDLRINESTIDTFMPLFEQTDVVDICDLYEELLGKAAIVYLDGQHVLIKSLRPPSPIRSILKRLFDVCFVLFTLPVTLPIFLLSAILVKLSSDGPIFFVQERLGRHGRQFKLIKLRTMVMEAEAFGARWSGMGDPRVTPLGRFLRTTGIDELPQLWNVLRGELSLVGPRPECPAIAAQLRTNIPLYQARLLVDPGITGWAQLRQGSDVDLRDVQNKLAYDLYYLQYHSLIVDCQIILGTIQMLLHMAKPVPRQASTLTFSSSKI